MKLKYSKRKIEAKPTRAKSRLDQAGDSAMIPMREILGYGTRENEANEEKVSVCFHHDLEVFS